MNGKPARSSDDVLLGVVVGARGIAGEVKVKTFTQAPDGIAAYGALRAADGRTLIIERVITAKPGEAVLRFAGVSDRNAAEALKGTELFVDRAALPEPAANEFYLADLIGLHAVDAAGAPLGHVAAVHNFGAGDVLEIALSGGDTEFVPFTDDAVPTVDIEHGRVVVVPPREDES